MAEDHVASLPRSRQNAAVDEVDVGLERIAASQKRILALVSTCDEWLIGIAPKGWSHKIRRILNAQYTRQRVPHVPRGARSQSLDQTDAEHWLRSQLYLFQSPSVMSDRE